EWLATSQQQQMFSLMRGEPTTFRAPIDNIEEVWTPREIQIYREKMNSESTIVGTPDVVREKLNAFINKTRAGEIIVNSQIFHHEDRLRSYEIVAEMME